MAERVLELGALTLDQVCARCDACRKVAPGVQYTGPNGYVTLCIACLVEISSLPVTIRPGALNG